MSARSRATLSFLIVSESSAKSFVQFSAEQIRRFSASNEALKKLSVSHIQFSLSAVPLNRRKPTNPLSGSIHVAKFPTEKKEEEESDKL